MADVDDAATSFQNLNFIVEHCGLPRLDDFCWIATQETNVFAGLAVALPFIHSRPAYFAHIISELLFWVGEDKILYGSDYAIWTPRWLVEKFMDFELPEDIAKETGVSLTLAGEEEDPRPERRQDLRHRHRGAEGKAARRRARRCGMSDGDNKRVSEVLARLDRVNDPELDESVTSLGFVTGVSVTGRPGRDRLPAADLLVRGQLRLPDGRRHAHRGRTLPWVSGVGVVLGEHMYAETINTAMTRGQSFQEAFAAEADGDLDALRRVFEVKAFQRRQMALLDHLLAAGHTPEALVALTVLQLRPLAGDAGMALVERYLERRGVPGPDGPDAPAFVDEHGLRRGGRGVSGAPADAAPGFGERRVQRRAVPRPARRAVQRAGGRADPAGFRAWPREGGAAPRALAIQPAVIASRLRRGIQGDRGQNLCTRLGLPRRKRSSQ